MALYYVVSRDGGLIARIGARDLTAATRHIARGYTIQGQHREYPDGSWATTPAYYKSMSRTPLSRAPRGHARTEGAHCRQCGRAMNPVNAMVGGAGDSHAPICQSCARKNHRAAVGQRGRRRDMPLAADPGGDADYEVLPDWSGSDDLYETFYGPDAYREAVRYADTLMDELERDGWTVDRSWASRDNMYAGQATKAGQRNRHVEVARGTEGDYRRRSLRHHPDPAVARRARR